MTPMLTEKQVEARLRWADGTIRTKRSRRHKDIPPAYQFGRQWRYDEGELNQWIASHKVSR